MVVVSSSCCNVFTLLLAWLAVVMLQSSLGIVREDNAVCSEMETGDVATAAVESVAIVVSVSDDSLANVEVILIVLGVAISWVLLLVAATMTMEVVSATTRVIVLVLGLPTETS